MQISARMWELWPQLIESYDSWACDYLEHILVPLENYISHGTETFLAGPQLQQVRSLARTAACRPTCSTGRIHNDEKLDVQPSGALSSASAGSARSEPRADERQATHPWASARAECLSKAEEPSLRRRMRWCAKRSQILRRTRRR